MQPSEPHLQNLYTFLASPSEYVSVNNEHPRPAYTSQQSRETNSRRQSTQKPIQKTHINSPPDTKKTTIPQLQPTLLNQTLTRNPQSALPTIPNL